jgi:hypothetical protein
MIRPAHRKRHAAEPDRPGEDIGDEREDVERLLQVLARLAEDNDLMRAIVAVAAGAAGLTIDPHRLRRALGLLQTRGYDTMSTDNVEAAPPAAAAPDRLN